MSKGLIDHLAEALQHSIQWIDDDYLQETVLPLLEKYDAFTERQNKVYVPGLEHTYSQLVFPGGSSRGMCSCGWIGLRLVKEGEEHNFSREWHVHVNAETGKVENETTPRTCNLLVSAGCAGDALGDGEVKLSG